MNTEKNERFLNEVCFEGKLEAYRNTLSQLFSLISKNGCRVSARYDVGYSNIEESVENSNHIRISLIAVEDPLDIIWKLLHEYGHFLSGKRKPDDLTIQREELAWSFADELIKDYPDLLVHQDAYIRCKQECLNSYRRKFPNT
ncbi:hypothetical protein [Terrimonas pollutisoli]|uniref:hypothetical protein n=1 Tax=Terrimonas pollutisoli TaxID=3034147 RepID=UPI0023EBF138|nr:hypothetical protein [Terrimonas sp. H1YJ31]